MIILNSGFMTLKRTGQSAAVMCPGPVENIGIWLGYVPVGHKCSFYCNGDFKFKYHDDISLQSVGVSISNKTISIFNIGNCFVH